MVISLLATTQEYFNYKSDKVLSFRWNRMISFDRNNQIFQYRHFMKKSQLYNELLIIYFAIVCSYQLLALLRIWFRGSIQEHITGFTTLYQAVAICTHTYLHQ